MLTKTKGRESFRKEKRKRSFERTFKKSGFIKNFKRTLKNGGMECGRQNLEFIICIGNLQPKRGNYTPKSILKKPQNSIFFFNYLIIVKTSSHVTALDNFNNFKATY